MNYPPMRSRRAFLAALILSVSFLFSAAAFAAEAKKEFDVPSGQPTTMLKQFTAQSGEQLLYSVDSLVGVTLAPVKGQLTPREALELMVAGTPLRVVVDQKNGAISLVRAPSPNAPSRPADRAAAQEAGSNIKDGVVKLDTFEVFGSKSINADLPRSRDDVQPYVTFDREQLQMSNALNLEDFFRTRLPMNNTAAAAPATQTPVSYSAVSLRGLSAQQTLILIDGRRAPLRPFGAAGNSFAQSDINGIPLAMIERVEILPSTASGIYGGGATGGVINIVTRKDFSGFELGLTYANTFDTDAAQRRVDLNGSISLEGGKTLLTLSSSYADGTRLTVQDRDIWKRGRTRQMANNPAAFLSAATPPLGYTPNIRSSTGANLVLKADYGGTNLGSAITYVPVGYVNLATSGVAPLLANAGKYNLDLADIPLTSGRTGIFNSPKVRNLTLGARRRFTANLETYCDFSMQDNLVAIPYGLFNATTLPVSAPNNPFTTPIIVTWPGTKIEVPYRNESKVWRASVVAVVRLPRDWGAGFEYSRSRSWAASSVPPIVGDPDGAGPLPSFATALTNGTLDVLRDLNQFPLDYAPYRMPKNYSVAGPFILDSQEWVSRASGPIWDLPAGPLTLAGSVSWRTEKQPAYVTENTTVVPSTYTWFPSASATAGSAYLETHVPVFSDKAKGLLRAMEIQASVRYDRSGLEGRAISAALSVPGPDGPFPTVAFNKRTLDAFSKTVGLKYSPLPDVTLRASWGTGFLAPTIGQLAALAQTTNPGISVIDPKRGGVLASTGPVQLISLGSGNPDLTAENSESLSAGLIMTPRVVPGLRLSVDYTRIDKTDEIANFFSFQDFFDNEDVLPGRIRRDPLTAQEQALGYTGGKVNFIDASAVNLAGRKIVAYDMQADYQTTTRSWGTFLFYAIATYQQRLATQVTPATRVIENIGYTSGLRWRGNGGINWRRGPWSATWNMQYYDSYIGYAPTATAPTIASYVLNQGTAKVPSQVFHDVTIGYQFRRGADGWRRWVGDTRLSVGVQDIFNKGPAVLASTSVASDRSGYGDPRMARYTISLRRQF